MTGMKRLGGRGGYIVDLKPWVASLFQFCTADIFCKFKYALFWDFTQRRMSFLPTFRDNMSRPVFKGQAAYAE
jgi:hypothetical protein